MLFIIVLVTMIGTTVFAFKEGKGNSRWLAIMPIFSYLSINSIFIVLVGSTDGLDMAALMVPNLAAGAILLAICAGIVVKIRKESLANALSDIEKGKTFEKKLEL